MKILDAKAAVDKEWKKARDPSMEFEKNKKEDILEAQRDKQSPNFHTDGHMSTQKRAVRTQNYRSVNAESCSGSDTVENDCGANEMFTEQVTAAKASIFRSSS